MADINFQTDDTADITDVVCPITFVKAKAALEKLGYGQTLAIKMNEKRLVTDMAVKVTADNFDTEILNFGGLVIADFYSDSCVPCKRMSPLLAEIDEQYESVKLAKINVNFNEKLAEKHDVMSVPALIFFNSGKELFRITGAAKKSEIIAIIENIQKGE